MRGVILQKPIFSECDGVKTMNEFFAYYRAMYLGTARNSRRGGWNLEILLIIISGLLVAGVTACLNQSYNIDAQNNISGTMFIYASTFVYVYALSAGVTRRVKPSVLNSAPISYKKRAVYSHLSVFISGLIFVACWFAAMLVFILLVSVITLIFTGDWTFLPAFEESAGLVQYPDAQGILFIILLFIALFGIGMAISYIKNKKVRYSMLFAWPAVFGAFALLLVNMSADGNFVICNNMLYNFKNLPLSRVWLAVFAVIAVAICAGSVYLGIKTEKPKNY